MTVSVHRNLNWMGGQGFSILDHTMRVVDRKLYVVLADCVFVVYPSGIKRAMETGHRNVHAFVRGEPVVLSDKPGDISVPSDAVEVWYNPFEEGGFYTADDGAEIWGAPTVWFSQGKAYVQ